MTKRNEKTSKKVASKAGKLLGADIDAALADVALMRAVLPRVEQALKDAKSAVASALTQAEDRK